MSPLTLEEISTPALVVHEATARRNIERLASYASQHQLAVRPHTKTHKSLSVAALQLAAGARGLTTAKVGEAEVMAEATHDLLVAYPVLDRHRTSRLARLAHSAKVQVAVDSALAIQRLDQAAGQTGSTVHVLVDLDVGMRRTGVQSARESLDLAILVEQAKHLMLAGLFCYPGHIGMSAVQQGPHLEHLADQLASTLALWQRHGLEAGSVSAGSTPTAFQSHRVPALTEIRPGTYVYYDMNCVRGDFCTLEDCAARIVCTVVSIAVPGQVVIDAGSKTLTSDRNARDPESGFGHVVEYPQAKIIKLTEEHGQVDIRDCSPPPKLGERVNVIPNHICPCVNLQDEIWWENDAGDLEAAKVDARGKLS